MTFRALVKKFLPEKLKRRISNQIVASRERRLGKLTIQEAFDEVYKKNMWKQGKSSSGLGSEGLLADRYIEFILSYAESHNIRTVVDAGCGDFSIGSRLAPHFDSYAAFDISPHIVEINKKRFSNLVSTNRVTFGVADMMTATFPSADLILIREVLQHLTNAQIERVLSNLEANKWNRTLIAEIVYDPENNRKPNLDLPSHTVRTRTSLESGVFIDREPFSRPAARVATLRRGDEQDHTSGLLIFELTQGEGSL